MDDGTLTPPVSAGAGSGCVKPLQQYCLIRLFSRLPAYNACLLLRRGVEAINVAFVAYAIAVYYHQNNLNRRAIRVVVYLQYIMAKYCVCQYVMA